MIELAPERDLEFVEHRARATPATQAMFDDGLSYVHRKCDIRYQHGRPFKLNAGIIGGSVSIDGTRDERRSADLTLYRGDEFKFSPDDEDLWYDKVITLYRGIVYRNEIHSWRLGTFLLDRVGDDSGDETITLTLRDFTKKMINSKFSVGGTIAKGTRVSDVVRALAANAGIADTSIPRTTEVLGKKFQFNSGQSRWEFAKEICDAYSFELFFNRYGRLVMHEYVDPLTAPISLHMAASKDGYSGGRVSNTVSYSRSASDTELYNHVIVIAGGSESNIPVWAQARTTNRQVQLESRRLDDAHWLKKASGLILLRRL